MWLSILNLNQMKKIKLLVDNPDSWMKPYAKVIALKLKKMGFETMLIENHKDLGKGWILFLLSCTKKLQNLNDFKYNIVIHASDLPKGKGWSPLSWQIIEGKSQIPISLFEVNENIDGGPIYFKDYLDLNGDELVDEARVLLANKIQQMMFKFILEKKITPSPQIGKSTFYSKRKPSDSELNIDKSLREQINLLRVCDNERYPAYFIYNNNKYVIKIYKDENL